MANRNKTPKRTASTSKVKQPRAAVTAERSKIPATGLPQAHSTRERPSWRFSTVDGDGPWSLSGCDAATFHGLVGKLRSFESMTCSELENGQTLKHYPVESLPTRAATDRLVALNLDDQTRISRLRLSGVQRLYGFLDEDSTFHILWWDPEHQVWPSEKKHT